MDSLTKSKLLLTDFFPEHSEFQMEHFIVGSHGGEWGQYRQVLREIAGRHPEMVKQAETISGLASDIRNLNKRWFKRKAKKEQLEIKLAAAKKDYKSKAREYFFFYRIAKKLKRKLGEITPQKRRELESQMWVEKAWRMAAVDLLSIGGLQRSTVEFIASFPRELRRGILADLRPENRQKLLSILE